MQVTSNTPANSLASNGPYAMGIIMATGETAQTTEAVIKTPLYLLPKFTCERWAEGIYDVEHQMVSTSLGIREDDLLTYDQRLELQTRSLVFQYQQMYAEKEYELLKKEFQDIEERLNRQETSDAEPAEHVFVKPDPAAKTRKNLTSSQSGSETEEKGTSTDEQVVSDDNKRSLRPRKKNEKKSGSEAGEKASATDPDVSDKKTSKTEKKQTKSKSGSEELTSSQEAEEPLGQKRRTRKK
ncbi:unnamed protein product [Larinioides sclopetarius]|uniref:Uncharacterized protein n=1 Tax=Larinioides sclopetarius TaxID=280406 RepID=A0AAV1Z4H4_9ARAC